MSDTNVLENHKVTSEEVFGPPQFDLIGLGLISFLSLVIGLLVGIGLFMLIYFTFGEFIFESGASSGFISLFAFICMTIGNIIYCWGITSIFPHIYSSTRTLYLQVTVFSVVLYICMSIVYFFIGGITPSINLLLGIYVIHMLLNTFGLLLIIGIISQYRYSILTFYSSLISLIISGITVYGIYSMMGESSKSLYILTGLAATVYLIVTVLHFGIGWMYLQLHVWSGADPLGDILYKKEQEERELERMAEKTLFSKN
ncbi:hypothetical protein KBD33_00185 [Candidatus Gracilibacteria bacterium]|nr:hypothetical protein [Candidatus Gracilibacteria bacterium]